MPTKRTPGRTEKRLPQVALSKLRTLEETLTEVNAAYICRLHREIEGLLVKVKTRGGRHRMSREETSELGAIVEWLDELEIKPEKGRRKDLRKIDKLIGKIQSVLDGWE